MIIFDISITSLFLYYKYAWFSKQIYFSIIQNVISVNYFFSNCSIHNRYKHKKLKIYIKRTFFIQADLCESYSHPQYGKTGRCMKASSCLSNIYLPNLCESKSINVKCCFNMTMSNKG